MYCEGCSVLNLAPSATNAALPRCLTRSGQAIGVARRDPELVRVLADDFALPLETWVTMHEDLRHSARCKVTFDALCLGLQHHVS